MSIFTGGVERRVERAEHRIDTLERELASLLGANLIQRLSNLENKEQKDMSTVNDAINRLQASSTSEGAAIDALTTAITTLTTDVNSAIGDLKNAINSQPNVSPQIIAAADAVDAQTQKLNALSQAVANLDTSSKASDPGTGGGTPVNG